MTDDLRKLLAEQEARINQKFASDREEREKKIESQVRLNEWVGVDSSDGKGVTKDPNDGSLSKGEIVTSGQMQIGQPVLKLTGSGGSPTINAMPTNYGRSGRRRYYPQIQTGKIAILAEVVYDAEDPIACSCTETRYIALTVETKRRFITMLLLDEQVVEIKASVAVLYKFITTETTPPEEPCGGCTTWNRRGNTCVPTCDGSEVSNTASQHNSLSACLAAPEPIWPDPNTRYPALYLWAGAIENLGFERLGCSVPTSEEDLYINHAHIIESQVLAWTGGAYNVTKPIAPSSYGDYEYRVVVGGSYGGFRIITANGWLGMAFTIFVYDSNGDFVKEVSCWSAYKEVLGGTYELPSSTVYFPFSNTPFTQPITWEKVYRLDDEICSPFNDVPRGQPPQERPHPDNRYINLYLGGDRQPTLIQKIHISERYSAYTIKTDATTDVVGIRIGQQQGNDKYCSIVYSEVTETINKQKVFYPELPTQFNSDWWHPYLNYDLSLPSYPNPIEQPYLQNFNLIFPDSESLNPYYRLVFEWKDFFNQQQVVKVEPGQPEAMYFVDAFKGSRTITRAIVCVNGNKGLLVNELIPANKNILTINDIVAVSPYFPPQKIAEQYANSTLSCTATIVYRAEVIESWSSGYSTVVYSYGYFNFATSSVSGGTFTGYGCNGELTAIVNAQYDGSLSYRNATPYRLCE